ncbi:MAG: hypothetical protein ACR2PI_23965 [Hyphomicrobiaceae bacterium]
MTTSSGPSKSEIERFARSYGLTKLTEAHLERMQQLASSVSKLGRDLPRPSAKSAAPAPCFQVLPPKAD